MSFTIFKQLLFSHDLQTREKMISHFIHWMNVHSRIHPPNLEKIHPPNLEKIHPPNPTPKRQIPKMIRGEVWKRYIGNSVTGPCYCCKRELDVFDSWAAGHVVARFHGGSNTVSNLRPICISCNTSMGTENLYEFKETFYGDRK